MLLILPVLLPNIYKALNNFIGKLVCLGFFPTQQFFLPQLCVSVPVVDCYTVSVPKTSCYALPGCCSGDGIWLSSK